MTTRHSIERAYQRTGCNRKSAARIIENAIERGMTECDFSGREQRYLARKTLKNPSNDYVFYNGAIYVLTPDNVCVTVLIPPRWFGKKRMYSGKTVIRNPKKAVSYNLISTEE